MKIEIKATPYANGDIELTEKMTDELNGALLSMQQEIIKTKSKLVKDALVSMGWTPPAREVNLIDNQEQLEDGCWYPVVYLSGDRDVLEYEKGLFTNSSANLYSSCTHMIWIGSKIQFPDEV